MVNTRKIRSKHNNLLNYFTHDKRYLSKAYVRSCEKFFKELKKKKCIITQTIIKNCVCNTDPIRPLATVRRIPKLQACARGPGLSFKLQASSSKRFKLQAAGLKPQAASFKLQAASVKLHDS